MQKFLISLLMFAISYSAFSLEIVITDEKNTFYDQSMTNSNQTALYANNYECISTYDNIVKGLLPEIKAKADVIGHEFCSIGDQTQGSYSVERVVSYCIKIRLKDSQIPSLGTLSFQTTGDYWCDGEILMSDKLIEISIK